MVEEYRDIHDNNKKTERGIKAIESLDMSPKQKKKIRDFVDSIKIGKGTKKAGDRRINIYMQYFIKLHKYFKKDFDKVNEKEFERFYRDCQSITLIFCPFSDDLKLDTHLIAKQKILK